MVYFIFNNILGEYTEAIYTANHKECSRQNYVTNIINENCTMDSHLYLPYCKVVTKDNKQSFLLKHHEYVLKSLYKTDICEHILQRIIENISISSSINKYQFCQHIIERIINDIV